MKRLLVFLLVALPLAAQTPTPTPTITPTPYPAPTRYRLSDQVSPCGSPCRGFAASLLGDTYYALNATTFGRIAGNTTTTRKFLTQTGTGSVSAAPIWGTLQAADVPSLLTTKGDILTYSTLPIRLGIGTNAYVLTADSGEATGMKWAVAATGTTSPLTTKGDVWGFSTVNARLPVGTNTYVLTADSTQTLGIKWAVAGGGAASDLLSATTTVNVSAATAPSVDQVLTATDSTHATWQDPSGGGGGVSYPGFIQQKSNGISISSITLDATPIVGHSILLALAFYNVGGASSVSSSNTTWTRVIGPYHSGGNGYYEIWVGICGSSPGAAISITHSNGYCSAQVLEISDTLTPTAGATYSVDTGTPGTDGVLTGTTAGRLIAVMSSRNNTSATVTTTPTPPGRIVVPDVAIGLSTGVVSLWVQFSDGSPAYAHVVTAQPGALLMVELH